MEEEMRESMGHAMPMLSSQSHAPRIRHSVKCSVNPIITIHIRLVYKMGRRQVQIAMM
jgi:hypothetical protein